MEQCESEKIPIVKPRGPGLRAHFTNYCSICGVKCICLDFEMYCNKSIGCKDPKQCDWNKIMNTKTNGTK